MNVNKEWKSEPALLPRRKRKTPPDEPRNLNDHKAETAPGNVLTDVDDISRFRWIDVKEHHSRPVCGKWIAKDHLGI